MIIDDNQLKLWPWIRKLLQKSQFSPELGEMPQNLRDTCPNIEGASAKALLKISKCIDEACPI